MCLDGESWGMDDEVISRLVEDVIDSELCEVLIMFRFRLVYIIWSIVWLCLEFVKLMVEFVFFVLFLLLSDKMGYVDVIILEVE